MTVEELVSLAPVIPVVVIDDVEDAVPLAEALVRGGLPAIEVTLRTDAALARDRADRAEVDGAVVGAGTVTTPAQVEDALAAGARFLVSPGATPTLLDALQASGVPFLPGHGDARRTIVALLERGITHAKLFPAEVVGGIKALKAFAGPFPQMRFCPTGGINAANAPDYLAQPNVVCVGGSWMTSGDVEAQARAAAEAGLEWPSRPRARSAARNVSMSRRGVASGCPAYSFSSAAARSWYVPAGGQRARRAPRSSRARRGGPSPPRRSRATRRAGTHAWRGWHLGRTA